MGVAVLAVLSLVASSFGGFLAVGSAADIHTTTYMIVAIVTATVAHENVS